MHYKFYDCQMGFTYLRISKITTPVAQSLIRPLTDGLVNEAVGACSIISIAGTTAQTDQEGYGGIQVHMDYAVDILRSNKISMF